MTNLEFKIQIIISSYTGCDDEKAEKCTRYIYEEIYSYINIAQEIRCLNNTLKDFRDDYRTAHGMNYEGGGGMFSGLFGRKK